MGTIFHVTPYHKYGAIDLSGTHMKHGGLELSVVITGNRMFTTASPIRLIGKENNST